MTEYAGSQNIKKRLEELHKWHIEQQRLMDEHDKISAYQKDDGIANRTQESLDVEELPKRRYLKRGEGLKNRFKIDPNSLRLHNLPKYKFAKVRNKSRLKLPTVHQNQEQHEARTNTGSVENENNIKLNFGHLNVQGDGDEEDSICESFSAGQEFKYVDLSNVAGNLSISRNLNTKEKNYSSDEFQATWAKVFDSYQTPFLEENFHDSIILGPSLNDPEHLKILELIRKKTHKENFNINTNLLQKWAQGKSNALFGVLNEYGEEEQIKELAKTTTFQLHCDKDQLPAELSEDSSEGRTSDFSENDEMITSLKNSKCEIKCKEQSDECHVRFSDEVKDLNNDEEISKAMSLYEENRAEFYNKSKDNSGFEKFKRNLFATAFVGNNDTPNDTTLIEQLLGISSKINGDEDRRDIIDKTEMLKNRLVELESEISTFRQNNSELLRLKQEHELNRIQLEQERLEMQEKFNDEKIKFEIHLHDERLKIEEEKRKLEKLIREQRLPNRKEKDEILKLKEEVEILQKELKNKDSKHVTAQARLRAQIRILEKEMKNLTFEIESLKKENKKLEGENARMMRQNNNKMLQEINKTIAKLAVKPVELPVTVAESHNKHSKPVNIEVVSHKRKSRISHTQKLSASKNQSYGKNDSSFVTDDEENFCSDDEQILNLEKNKSRLNNSFLKKNSKNQQKDEFFKNGEVVENTNKKQIDSETFKRDSDKFKREIEHPDGSKDIWYPNGNLKKISSDGLNIKMLYFNKDIKETNISEGTVRYYYADKNTWHTTYLDGLEILEFPNGQTEHRHKNGAIEVHFPNGSIRVSNPSDQNKSEEWKYADGTNCVLLKNGDKILSFPNGQKEIHTKIHKRREYPDGTIKIVYPDGSQETRYSNGRIRLKDKDGNLIMDSASDSF